MIQHDYTWSDISTPVVTSAEFDLIHTGMKGQGEDRQVSRQTCVAFAGVGSDVTDAIVIGDVSSRPEKTEDDIWREEESDGKTRRVHDPV